MAATLKDVADLAGVSVKTVSNVVNGYRPVGAATRQRVQQAIDELGYSPNLSARHLRNGRTGIIVAHRLATVAFADDILVLEDGQVREYGPRLALAADPTSRFAGLLRGATEEVCP